MRVPNRRQVLAAIVLAPIVCGAAGTLSGCGVLDGLLGEDTPDPLTALADRARADAALAAAVAAAAGTAAAVTATLREVGAARTAHAAALDAEIARRAGGEAPAAAAAAAADPAVAATPAALRDALTASADAAAKAALELPADRVGLVASVSASCAAHAEALT